ncbi:hypothetical protein BU15DRAFT_68028 [Melanogaster broomeanus]|nr:hypothetical protein BU15DRAFT_68028 [Melanogaster broomeanus]
MAYWCFPLSGTSLLIGWAGWEGVESHAFVVGMSSTMPHAVMGLGAYQSNFLTMQLMLTNQCQVYTLMKHLDGIQMAYECKDWPSCIPCDICDAFSRIHRMVYSALKITMGPIKKLWAPLPREVAAGPVSSKVHDANVEHAGRLQNGGPSGKLGSGQATGDDAGSYSLRSLGGTKGQWEMQWFTVIRSSLVVGTDGVGYLVLRELETKKLPTAKEAQIYNLQLQLGKKLFGNTAYQGSSLILKSAVGKGQGNLERARPWWMGIWLTFRHEPESEESNKLPKALQDALSNLVSEEDILIISQDILALLENIQAADASEHVDVEWMMKMRNLFAIHVIRPTIDSINYEGK